jgi:nitrogen fixation NifU-like protein
MLTDSIKGRPLAEIAKLGRQDVLDELGIPISPARLKCALLSLDTLRRALADRVAWQASTEDGVA